MAGTWVVIAVALATAREASAQHHHMAMPDETSRPFTAEVTALAASFDTGEYAGDYEGLGLAFGWRATRGGAHLMIPMYRLQENGATHVGPGDVMLGGDVTAIARARWRAGASLMATVPTGDALVSLGMGHPMLMPAAWASLGGARAMVTASAGYARALASLAGHMHGIGPLVEPMNGSELTGEVRADLAPWSPPLAVTVRVAGAVPVGADGTTRVIGAVGAMWRRARFETGVELQLGLAGDPFTFRGLVETAVHF
jgi:hypothetical protein